MKLFFTRTPRAKWKSTLQMGPLGGKECIINVLTHTFMDYLFQFSRNISLNVIQWYIWWTSKLHYQIETSHQHHTPTYVLQMLSICEGKDKESKTKPWEIHLMILEPSEANQESLRWFLFVFSCTAKVSGVVYVFCNVYLLCVYTDVT